MSMVVDFPKCIYCSNVVTTVRYEAQVLFFYCPHCQAVIEVKRAKPL